ncbi:MAG: hypothetical protein EOM91_06475 [Sphingobacteriia bacterium]|nr:hypothetical protein [Sphingobacteriia bacterium]NCC39061.1 hypothetical protein [Gammaproteobacteria bacterium]
MRRSRRRADHGAAALLMLTALAVGGCQSSPSQGDRAVCEFKPGMTTDMLSQCGCFPGDTRNDGALMLMSESSRNNSMTINIVPYLCPLGAAGVARIQVINGVASTVYR